jgi:hypothetical protein
LLHAPPPLPYLFPSQPLSLRLRDRVSTARDHGSAAATSEAGTWRLATESRAVAARLGFTMGGARIYISPYISARLSAGSWHRSGLERLIVGLDVTPKGALPFSRGKRVVSTPENGGI